MSEKSIENLSVEELQALLDKKQKRAIQKKKREREKYEKRVNDVTSRILRKGVKLSEALGAFKAESFQELEALREELNKYGDIKANSKGGFTLRTDEGDGKVLYKYTSISDWDERAGKAEALLIDFLSDVVKKRDKDLYELILGLLEKNKEGKLEFSRIQALYARETLFTDPRWVEAIRLFKESFRVVDSKMRLELHVRDEVTKEFKPVLLNLSSL